MWKEPVELPPDGQEVIAYVEFTSYISDSKRYHIHNVIFDRSIGWKFGSRGNYTSGNENRKVLMWMPIEFPEMPKLTEDEK